MTEQYDLALLEQLANENGSEAISPTDLLAQIGQVLSLHQLFSPTTGLASSERPEEFLPPRQPVVIGVSGGADSLCLLYALQHLADVWAIDLHVAHLNHNLREDAEYDALFVARTAAALALPIHLASIPAGQLYNQSGGLENAAREVRYRYLCEVARSITPPGQEPIVAVAHHANDQAETILLNLIRGSGLRGLSGMEWITYRQGVRIVRPLLMVAKSHILAFLRANHLTWMEDSTNQDQSLFRNRLRHTVIPILEEANPQVIRTLGRTAEVIRTEQVRIEAWDRKTFRQLQVDFSPTRAVASTEKNRCILDLAQLLDLDLATQRNMIRLAIEQVAEQGLRNFGFETIDSFVTTLQTETQMGITHSLRHAVVWTTGRIDQSASLYLSIHQESSLPFEPNHPLLDHAWQRLEGAVVVPRSGILYTPNGWNLHTSLFTVAELPTDWQENRNEWSAYLDEALVSEMILTTPKSGQRFDPMGLQGKHKSLGNLFTDNKILRTFRNNWPLILDVESQKVLWVCGLQQANHARITSATKNVLHLTWLRSE